jgi:hypothetical protein
VKRATDDAYVEGLTLKFPKEGEGLCGVELWVPGRASEDGETGDLTWELWLDGHPFAAGVVTPDVKLPQGKWTHAQLKLPLVFRNLSWSADPRELRARFRGRLVRKFAGDAPATPIDEQRVVLSEGAPQFDRGLLR